jgi:hypothetical protein
MLAARVARFAAFVHVARAIAAHGNAMQDHDVVHARKTMNTERINARKNSATIRFCVFRV